MDALLQDPKPAAPPDDARAYVEELLKKQRDEAQKYVDSLVEREAKAKPPSVASDIGNAAKGLAKSALESGADTIEGVQSLGLAVERPFREAAGQTRAGQRRLEAESGDGLPGAVRGVAEAIPINPKTRAQGGIARFLASDVPHAAGGVLPLMAGGPSKLAVSVLGGAAAHTASKREGEASGATQDQQDANRYIQTLLGAAAVAGPAGALTRPLGKLGARVTGDVALGVGQSLIGQAGAKATIHPEAEVDVGESIRSGLALGTVGVGMHGAGKAVESLRRGAAQDETVRAMASEGATLRAEEPKLQETEPLTRENAGQGDAFFDPESGEWRVPVPEAVTRGTPSEPAKSASEELAQLDAEIAAQAKTAAPGERAPVRAPSQEQPPPSQSGRPETTETAPKVEESRSGKLPPPVGDEKLVGIKNAAADAQAAFYGDEPPKHGEAIIGKDQFEAAAKRLTEDNESGQRLISELSESPRPPSTEESALLGVEVVRLTNERDAASKAWDAEPSQENRARVEKAQADYSRALDVVTVVGTKSAQAFGLRRWMLKNDYSVAELTRQQKMRNEGAPVSPEQEAAIKKTHEEYESTLKAQEEALRAREEAVSKREAEAEIKSAAQAATRKPRAPSRASAVTERISKAAEGARERMRARLRTPHAGVDPQAIADLAIIAAEHVSKGVDAALELVKEFGDWVKPHLTAVIEQAAKYAKGASLELIQERIGARLKDGAELKNLRPYVRKLQEHFYREGVREIDPMIDAVHGALRAVKPDTTRRQAMDLISGYGDVRPLDKSQMAAELRDLRGRMQQLGKLADMEKGLAPLKSGPERREPTAAERKLIQRVAEMKKKLGIAQTDPETQLKSTLDSIKTRLRHQIEDLQRQIDTREADALDRAPAPTDREVVGLRSQRDALKVQFEEVFGKAGPADEQRAKSAIAAVEKSIADYEQRIRASDLAPKPERQGPPTEAVARLRAEREALNARRDALRAELEALRAGEKPRVDREARAIEKQIEALTKRIETRDISSKPERQGPPTESVGRLRVERAMLQKKLADLRKSELPVRTPEEIAAKAAQSRLAQSIARMQEKMSYGDFSPRTRKPKPLLRTPELEKAIAEHERVKQEYETRKAEEEFRSRSTVRKAAHYAQEIVIGLPRAFKTAWDLSAPGRQGIVFGLSHPWLTATQHIPLMLKAVPSEARFREIDARIQNRPGAEFGRMSKLDLTEHGGKLTKGEEAIRSNWSDKIPGIRASNRAYITFLNAQRATIFDMLVGSYQGQMTPEIGRVFAHAVNVGSGRGEAKSIAQAMAHAAKILWAPKLLLSRVQMLTGEPLWRGNARTRRKLAVEMYVRPLISLSALMALGKLAGGDEEDDPRSTDFGKVKFGNTRVDLTGGMLQMVVLAARTISGEKRTATGKLVELRGDAAKFGSGTVWDEWTGFMRKKLAPTLGSAVDVATGKNVVGEPVTPGSALADAFLPLAPSDVYEAFREQGATKGAAFGLMSLFGLGVQSYDQKGLGGAGIPELAKVRAKTQSMLAKLRKAREVAVNAGESTESIDRAIRDVLESFNRQVMQPSSGSGTPQPAEAANR